MAELGSTARGLAGLGGWPGVRLRREPDGPRAGRAPPDVGIVRSRGDALWMATGAVALGLSALPVSRHRISGAERSVFDVVNDLPSPPFPPIWLLMQLGNFAVVPAAAVVALLLRRPRLALTLAVAGILAYGLAKVVKRFVPRGRPASLIPDVEIRGAEAFGLGFVSGHAAVAVALALAASAYLGRRWRWVGAGLACFVCLARVYVGAHLPLDVVGGAALGLLVGAALRLALGRPAACS